MSDTEENKNKGEMMDLGWEKKDLRDDNLKETTQGEETEKKRKNRKKRRDNRNKKIKR